MPKLKTGERRVYVKFTRPEDIELLERLERDANDTTRRYDLNTYLLLVLHAAYPKSSTTEETPLLPAQ